jgi:hypothetical protein
MSHVLILTFLKVRTKIYLNFQDREALRKSVKNFIVKNQEIRDAEIVNHNFKEGYVRSTIYRTIKRTRYGKPVKQSHLGKKSKIWTPRKTSQATPIETFWAQLSRMVYKAGWQAKNRASIASKNQTENQ